MTYELNRSFIVAPMRNPVTPLGGTEMEVLQHVWTLGRASARDVYARVAAVRPVAYTTIMTILKNLADKGYLTYEQAGTAYIYAPARPATEVRGGLLAGFVEKVFGGSKLTLFQTLAQQETLTEAERAALQTLIDRMEDTP